MQKMPPDCTQERVFYIKTHPKCQKISACGGHIIIEIRLVNAPKVYFFRACGGPKSQCFFCFVLVYRAPLDKHKTLNVDPL